MTCDACEHEPRVGRIDVPDIGSFGIGERCLALQRKTLADTLTINDFADITLLTPADVAAQAWLRELTREASALVSPRIRWKLPCEVCVQGGRHE